MSQHVTFLVLGLASGAVFAALAMALVVTYRSSGALNFAIAPIALHAAYTYAFLRRGELMIPVPVFRDMVALPWALGLVPAIVLTLAIEAVVGMVLYLIVFRPLRRAAPLARAIASLGVMLALTAALAQEVGTAPLSVDPIFTKTTLTLGDIRVPADRLSLAGTIVIVALVLGLVFRFTRFGLLTRATAETETGSIVSGISPDRVFLGNWALSTAVAALAGILIAPIVPLAPVAYLLFIVPALAAAVLGRFELLAPAVIGGLAIGCLQSEAVYLQSTYDWLPRAGVAELIPLVLVLVLFARRSGGLPARGELLDRSLGRAARPRRVLIAAGAGIVAAGSSLLVLQGSYRAAFTTSLIMAVIALSLVVVSGYGGLISLAQLTIAGVSGFVLSAVTVDWGVPFPIAPLIAAGAAAVVGTAIGFPALRIRGLPLAVVTLSMAVALEAVWFRNNALNGGLNGSHVEPPSFLGIDLRIGTGASYPRPQFGFLCLLTLTAVALGVAKLRTSRVGLAMLAVKNNERSAAAAGISVVRTKLVGFAFGAFVAGIGGALLAYRQTTVTWESFSVILGLGVFAVAFVGGITSIRGALIAGMASLPRSRAHRSGGGGPLRRRHRDRPREPRRSQWLDRGCDRPEWCGQDIADRRHRWLRSRGGVDHTRWHRDQSDGPALALDRSPRPHVSGTRPLRRPHGARERAGRGHRDAAPRPSDRERCRAGHARAFWARAQCAPARGHALDGTAPNRIGRPIVGRATPRRDAR